MKLKFIYSFITFFVLTQSNIAQIRISGHIKDEQTNEALTGVAIYISDLNTGATSNEEGNYKIENIKPGNYLFEYSYTGYKKRVERIFIEKDTIINILISQSVSELNEVVVTAVTRSTELKFSHQANRCRIAESK